MIKHNIFRNFIKSNKNDMDVTVFGIMHMLLENFMSFPSYFKQTAIYRKTIHEGAGMFTLYPVCSKCPFKKENTSMVSEF